MRNLAASLGIALLALAAVWLFWPDAEQLPDATFTLTDGRVLHSSDLRGKSVLITFWSVSCAVCLRDMPRLTRLHETLQDSDFMVLGVAMPHDPPPAVISTVAQLQPGYPIALDVHGEVNRAFGGIAVTPTTYLVRPDGSINFVEQGPLDETRIRATVLTFQR